MIKPKSAQKTIYGWPNSAQKTSIHKKAATSFVRSRPFFGDWDDEDSEDDFSDKNLCKLCGENGDADPHDGLCAYCKEATGARSACPSWRGTCEYSPDEGVWVCDM